MTKQQNRASAARSVEARRAALAALYERLPPLQCQGLCSASCYSLVQTPTERDMIAERTGVQLQTVQVGPCPALTMLRRCGVYDVRPLLCRLWGLGESPLLRCPYGCEPEGGRLTDVEVDEWLARAADIDGDRATARFLRGRSRLRGGRQ